MRDLGLQRAARRRRCVLVSTSVPSAARPPLAVTLTACPAGGGATVVVAPTDGFAPEATVLRRRRFELLANELAHTDSDRLLRDDFGHSIAERKQHQPARQNVIDAEALDERQAPERRPQYDRRHEEDRQNCSPFWQQLQGRRDTAEIFCRR